LKDKKPLPIIYKEIKLDYGYRLDLVVENKVIIELKSIDGFAPVHEAQILTYMKLSNIKVGLLINFNVTVLKKWIEKIHFIIFVDLREFFGNLRVKA